MTVSQDKLLSGEVMGSLGMEWGGLENWELALARNPWVLRVGGSPEMGQRN